MELILGILATYYVTLVLTTMDAPFGIARRLRQRLSALQCFICTSVYVGLTLSILAPHSLLDTLLYGLAFAGGAVLIDEFTA